MSLIIQNIDTVDVAIDDLGITLVPTEQYDLAQDRSNKIATSTDLPAAIVAGTIAVLDPLDDTTPLSVARAQDAVAATNDTHYRIKGGDLNQLEDVTLTSPANNQVLTYNGADWVNQTPVSTTQDLWATFNADTGSTTANTPLDALTVSGTTNQIVTSITGDTLTTSLAPNTTIPGTEGIQIPSGTTAERPTTPTIGDMRFNTTTGTYEAWDGVQWVTFGSGAGSNVKQILFGQLPHAQGTTTTPADDTPPLITEGTEFFTQNVTMTTSTGRVVVWFSSMVTVSNSNRVATIALYRDTTLVGITTVGVSGSNNPTTATFIVVDNPPAAGTYTYTGRIGVSASATWYIGGFTSNYNYGGATNTNNQYVLMRIE